MSKPWPLVPLGEVLAERQEVPSPDALISGEIPILSKIGFNDGLIQLRREGQTKTDMILIRPSDLVVSGINAAKGAIAIYGQENTQPIAATIHYGAYIPNKERVDISFLWWLLRSRTFRELLFEYVPGGIKPELKAKRFLPIPIPLPSLLQQQQLVVRIKGIADKFDEARRLRAQSSSAAENWMNACLQDTMSRFTNLCRFGDVITFKPRSGPSFPTNPAWSGTPVLMPSAVTGFGVDTNKVEFGIGNDKLSEKDLLDRGDILIARGNKREQVGNAGIVPNKARGWTYANLLMRLKVDLSRVDQRFCIYWLRSPQMRSHVRSSMTGTNPNIQKVNQQIILNYPFPKNVPLSEQRRSVTCLDDLQAKVDALKKLQSETAAELDALLPSILDKAFKGEL